MAENLMVTHYRNGDEIPTGNSNAEWSKLSSGAFTVYDNDTINIDNYGYLYNWYAIDDERDICPEGWYVPSDDDYKLLEMHLGMNEVEADTTSWRGTDEGGKLKEEGLEHWDTPNTGATNESGFTGLPGGARSSNGSYFNIGDFGYYWTSSTNFSNDAWYRFIGYNQSKIARQPVAKRSGQSVRCITYESETGIILVPQEFLTIQAAIDVASDGDTILVSAGTYFEHLNFNGKNIVIEGEDKEITIIDGSQNNGYGVVHFSSGEDSTAVLSGFTLQNGYSLWGAGIRCEGNSSPTLKDLIITNNSAQGGGGMFITEYSDPTLIRVAIIDNSAYSYFGGGMYIKDNSAPKFINVTISGNSAAMYGGGMYIHDFSNPTLMGVTISSNTAVSRGGGIHISGSSINGSNLLINNNYAEGHGGGIFISAGSNINLNKSTIASNMVGESYTFGAGIYADGGTASLINSIVYYNRREGDYGINYNLNGYTMDILNEYTVSYSDIEGDANWIPEGVGNISIGPEVIDFENGDFNLQPSSPCIDSGDPASELDPDGTRADMGVYYFHQIYGCADPEACNYNPDASVDDGSCNYPDCTGVCNNGVTISNQWSDGYHYDFTYTLGELTDYEGQLLQQIAQRDIKSLIVTCQETGQIWSFDSEQIGSGNGNHNFSYLQGQYEDFPLPTRNISNGVLIGIDTYSTGNYHSLWLSVTAIDDEGSVFTHDNYVDTNPFGWYDANEITFPALYFTEVVDYANLDVLYAEGSFPVAGITYQIGGGSYSEGFVCDETCQGSLSGSDCENSITIVLHEGSNLMSFSVLPEDNSVENVLSSDNISAIAGEGEAAINTDMGWVGSLTNILYENGYWLLLNEAGMLTLTGIPIDPDQQYALHAGNNLISYPISDCGSIDEVLSDEVEECIYAIAGEGVAALNAVSGWVGSLSELCPDEGYWFVNICDEITFTFDEPTGLSRKQVQNPSPNPYSQSSQQAFYFIEAIDNIEVGDWILAYSGDKVIGARQWQGSTIDVPAMGDDGTDYTKGYMEAGMAPTFKVQRDGELIDLKGYVPAWSENRFFIISNLTQEKTLPETFSLQRAYPNPFNPTTTISFALPKYSNVLLEVYDINGRIVSTLVDNMLKDGYHSVVWNADSYSSGVYFVKMQAGDFMSIQKLLLVK